MVRQHSFTAERAQALVLAPAVAERASVKKALLLFIVVYCLLLLFTRHPA